MRERSLPAGRAPHEQREPEGVAFSVAARSQVHDPAGRAPIVYQYWRKVLMMDGGHTARAAGSFEGVLRCGLVTTALECGLLTTRALGLLCAKEGQFEAGERAIGQVNSPNTALATLSATGAWSSHCNVRGGTCRFSMVCWEELWEW